MAINAHNFQNLLKQIPHLSTEQRQELLAKLTDDHRPEKENELFKLVGLWEGIEISANEIDKARRECWKGLGGEA